MARNTWAIEMWNGTAWVADGSIYRPNTNTEIDSVSTQTKLKLSDGSNAFVTPEVPYENTDISFQFLEIFPTDSFYTKIQAYVQNQTYVRITTHLGETFAGKFFMCKRVWQAGVEDVFDIEVVFQRMDGPSVTSGGVAPQGGYVNWGSILGTIESQTDLIAYIAAHGADAAWGAISGVLANQTDLQAALNAKSDISHLHDDRYYTKPVISSYLAGKANVAHSHTIDSLSDVVVNSGLASGQSLIWNASAGVWFNKTLRLMDLGDVNVDGPQHNDVLTYDSGAGKWRHKPSQGGGGGGSATWGLIIGSISAQTDLIGLLATYAPLTHNHDERYSLIAHTHDDRYYTKTQTSTFLNAKADSIHAHSLDSLTDVLVNSGLADRQVLMWNSAAGVWHNAPITGYALTNHSHGSGQITLSFLNLSDTPDSYSANKGVRVNSGGTGLEFYTITDVAATWGQITGTLANQTDLTGYLSATYSVLSHRHDDIYYTKSQTMTYLNAKSDIVHGHYLDNLWDVVVNSGLADRQVLMWNMSAGVWHNAPITGFALTNHSHTAGQVSLAFLNLSDAPNSYSSNAGKGVRVNPGATGLEFYTIVDVAATWGNITGTVTNQTDLISYLSGTYAVVSHLHDDRYFTKTQTSTLLNAKADSIHNHTLDSLSDVVVNSGIIGGHVLVWNSAAGVWHNQPVPADGINTEIQFNKNGLLGSSSHLTWTDSTSTLYSPFINTNILNSSSDLILRMGGITDKTRFQYLDQYTNTWTDSFYIYYGNIYFNKELILLGQSSLTVPYLNADGLSVGGTGMQATITMGEPTTVGYINWDANTNSFAFTYLSLSPYGFPPARVQVADPVASLDATNKSYVDQAVKRENLWDRHSGTTALVPYYQADNVQVGDTTLVSGENPYFSIYGYITAGSASKYVYFMVDDRPAYDDWFYLRRGDTYIQGFDISMPLRVEYDALFQGQIQIGTSGVWIDNTSGGLTFHDGIAGTKTLNELVSSIARENLWDRNSGTTTLVPYYSNDSINIGAGTLQTASILVADSTIAYTDSVEIYKPSGSLHITSTTTTNPVLTYLTNASGHFTMGIEKNTGGWLLAGTSAYDAVLSHTGAYNMQFGLGGTIRATLSNAGNFTASTFSFGTGKCAYDGTTLSVKSTTGSWGSPFSVYDANNNLCVYAITGVSGVGGGLIINQSNVNFSFNARGYTDNGLLYVQPSTDRVGVGTDSPSYKLDVNGTIRGTSLMGSGLTVGAIPYVSTGGLLATTSSFGFTGTQTLLIYGDTTSYNNFLLFYDANTSVGLQIFSGVNGVSTHMNLLGIMSSHGLISDAPAGAYQDACIIKDSGGSYMLSVYTGSAGYAGGGAVVFNEGGLKMNVRMETDTVASAFNLDGDAETLTLGVPLFLSSIKSGSTQSNAGAAANELWKTNGHATLPNNVVMIGV